MYHIRVFFALTLVILCVKKSEADNVALSVWANEAIVATYTYDYENFMQRQKEIAKYFTGAAWTAYSAAFQASKLPESVQKNSYAVSAVATLPPEIKEKQVLQGQVRQWEAGMPLRVLYKNPQFQQKQDLFITITFMQAPSGQGVRGLVITSFQSKPMENPCPCGKTREALLKK